MRGASLWARPICAATFATQRLPLVLGLHALLFRLRGSDRHGCTRLVRGTRPACIYFDRLRSPNRRRKGLFRGTRVWGGGSMYIKARVRGYFGSAAPPLGEWLAGTAAPAARRVPSGQDLGFAAPVFGTGPARVASSAPRCLCACVRGSARAFRSGACVRGYCGCAAPVLEAKPACA